MKKSMKSFVLGVLVGALLISVPAFAQDIWERIDVVRNKIVVMVGGEKLEADNFLYKDTTYVPIRAVAEGLGMNVTFKDGVAYIDERYAAKFDGERVELSKDFEATTGEIDAYINLYKHSSAASAVTEEQLKAAALEDLLRDKALIAIAEENNIVAGKEFYEKFSDIMAYMQMNYGSKEASEKAMEEAGYTYEMYKRYQEVEYLYSELAKTDAFKATEADILNFYQTNGAQYAYDGVQAKHILVAAMDEKGNPITDEAQLKKIEEKANSVYKEAIGGADFDELVKKYGEDPGVASNPDGYIFTKGEMVKEFEDTAFALKDGEISKPVKTQFGWHIIKRIKTIEKQPLTDQLSKTISTLVTREKINAAVNAKIAK